MLGYLFVLTWALHWTCPVLALDEDDIWLVQANYTYSGSHQSEDCQDKCTKSWSSIRSGSKLCSLSDLWHSLCLCSWVLLVSQWLCRQSEEKIMPFNRFHSKIQYWEICNHTTLISTHHISLENLMQHNCRHNIVRTLKILKFSEFGSEDFVTALAVKRCLHVLSRLFNLTYWNQHIRRSCCGYHRLISWFFERQPIPDCVEKGPLFTTKSFEIVQINGVNNCSS